MSLQALFDSFNGKRVLVLGDVMIDDCDSGEDE
jgi:bifunctional ADP-heptose synthase (sugar kinase/adenylyltransferase)